MPLLLAASEISRSCLAAGQIESAFGFLIWVKANAAEAALIALYVNFGPDGRAKRMEPKEDVMAISAGCFRLRFRNCDAMPVRWSEISPMPRT